MNTLLDGANGLVLAAETAIGQHPVGAVDMVLNMIERFRRLRKATASRICSKSALRCLPSLHGRQSLEGWPSRRHPSPPNIISRLPAIEVNVETALDIEQIAHGVYSPLRGFMTEAELESVLENNRLPSGDVWTMPIVLQGKSQDCCVSARPVGSPDRQPHGPSGRDPAN